MTTPSTIAEEQVAPKKNTLSLKDFIRDFGQQLLETTTRLFPPLVSQTDIDGIPVLKRPAMGGQRDALAGIKVGLEHFKCIFVVADMGTGKSYMSLIGSELAKFNQNKSHSRTLVICPSHLTKKWAREVVSSVDRPVRIIERIKDLKHIQQQEGFFILSKETMKLGSRWKAAVVVRRTKHGSILTCPCCGVKLEHRGLNLTLEDLEKKKRQCANCKNPLWQVDNAGPKRVALADYICKKLPRGTFRVLILDEGHEFRNGDSAQAIAATKLSEHCTKTLLLTGTLFGGYASTLFHLLWRFHRSIRDRYGIDDEAQFINDYGLVEKITINEHEEDGKTSSRTNARVTSKEKPGVNPSILCDLLKNTIFLRLSDLGEVLPPYEETILEVDMDPDQADDHHRFVGDLMYEVRKNLARGGGLRLLGAALIPMLMQPDTPWVPEDVFVENQDGSSRRLAWSAPLPMNRLYPKEKALVQYVLNRKNAGRKVLVYAQGMEKRDITKRLKSLLELNGIRTMVLKSDTVAAKDREQYVYNHQDSIDVLICHPRSVQTGLDLLAFPSILFYQTEYSTFTVRQSSRRSWRIGQHLPVEVTFMAYKVTAQERALRLIAAKAQSSLALEGELNESSLTNLAADDPLIALARSLISNEAEAPVFHAPRDWQPTYINEPIPASVQVLKPITVTGGLYTLERAVKQHHAKKSTVQPGDFMLFPPEQMMLETA